MKLISGVRRGEFNEFKINGIVKGGFRAVILALFVVLAQGCASHRHGQPAAASDNVLSPGAAKTAAAAKSNRKIKRVAFMPGYYVPPVGMTGFKPGSWKKDKEGYYFVRGHWKKHKIKQDDHLIQ